VEVHLVQMAPLALCNYVSYDLQKKNPDGTGGEEQGGGKKHCVVALDIGADSANLVITDGQRIIWQRPIPLGGNHLTRALTKDMKLTFAKAEHLKRNATKSPDLKKILASLKPVLNDFVGEVQRSLGYFTNTHRDAQVEYMVGLGNAFRLPGMQRFLAEKLQLDVRKLQKFERLTGDAVVTAPPFTENLPSFAVAYGLAVQGMSQGRIQTNLLPPEVRVERLVRAKKPWAAAAAAALLFGVTALTLGYWLDVRAYTSTDLKKAEEEATKTGALAQSKLTAFNDQQKKVEEEEDQVRSLVAGDGERLNWPALHKFIADVLPRPDEKSPDANLPREAVKVYWTDKAKAAHAGLRDKQARGITGKDQFDKDSQFLIQFNLEAMDCRYFPDLKQWWSSLSLEEAQLDSVRPKGAPAPEGKGWVVELRGYTYNKEGERYVKAVLVENIAPIGIKPPPKPRGNQPGGAQPGGAAPPGGEPAVEPQDPVIDRVGNIVLYATKQSTPFTSFSLISSSTLSSGPGVGGGQG